MSRGKYYLDTSIILPYYREESKSKEVENFLFSLRPPLIISDLTRVEFASILARWVRLEELSEQQADLIQSTFDQDIHSGLYNASHISSTQYIIAEKWISRRNIVLTTIDALHLACADECEAIFMTCDETLHHAAGALGLKTRLL